MRDGPRARATLGLKLEQLERTLGASGEARLTGMAPLAWHLRQRDGPRAPALAREGRELQLAQDELARKNKLLEQAYLQQQKASFTDPLTQCATAAS